MLRNDPWISRLPGQLGGSQPNRSGCGHQAGVTAQQPGAIARRQTATPVAAPLTAGWAGSGLWACGGLWQPVGGKIWGHPLAQVSTQLALASSVASTSGSPSAGGNAGLLGPATCPAPQPPSALKRLRSSVDAPCVAVGLPQLSKALLAAPRQSSAALLSRCGNTLLANDQC